MHKLAKAGAIAIGIVYVLVGVVALLSLVKLRNGGADESNILNLFATIPLGKVILALIFLGLLAYIAWVFYSAVKDPYGYGSNLWGLCKRAGTGAAALAYAMIAYSAVMAFLDLATETHGQPTDERKLVWDVFQWQGGGLLVALFGGIVAITGIAQFVYVAKKAYREKLNWKAISKTKKRIIAALAWAGHFARGVILLIIGYFLLKAAWQKNAGAVVNTDKAFDFLGDHVNHFSFILVAAGTICYGFYMFSLSAHYDFDDDYH